LTPDPDHTWLVECFAPGIDDAVVAAAADRVRTVVSGRADVVYLGALLMAEDEVVFHAFRASDAASVREASSQAGLQFEWVVESIGVLPGAVADEQLTEHLIRGGIATGPGGGPQQRGALP
jgi:hypothetical protein